MPPGSFLKGTPLENDKVVIGFDELISSLNHEDIPRKYVETRVIMKHDAKSHRHWCVHMQTPEKLEHALVLEHHIASSHVAHVRCSSVGSQEIRGYHVFHYFRYAHVDKA